ncbi:T9SS type A sorting domain-containing protein [candidate division KSB1 bacterium]|nr:T9SS type A sorting domain-containing protein [candidate division KSB1 bacterium]
MSNRTDQTINQEGALLWENDWTLQPDNSHYFGTISTISYHGMAYLYDDKLLLFGGMDSGRLQETFIYDLSSNSWSWQNLSTLPQNRQNMGMAHLGGDKVLLFGGQVQFADWRNDTWIYDYSEHGWTEMSPSTNPAARKSHAMAYIGDDKVLLFGGYTNGLNSETWIYDQSENNWTNKNPASRPSARDGHAMAYIGSDKVVLFGGGTGGFNMSEETWVYDLSQNNWTNQTPEEEIPQRRTYHDMAYIGEGQVVLYGGTNVNALIGGGIKHDTWIYTLNTNSWAEDENAIGSTPGNRVAHAFSETSMNGSTKPVLFGGSDDMETWVFGGGDYLVDENPSTITVSQPNGGETWYVGNSNNISWESDAYSGTVNIQLSTSGGSSWTSITSNTGNDGSYAYTPDGSKVSTQCLIKVTSNEAPAVGDESNAVFTIAVAVSNPPPTNLVSLNGYHQAVPLAWQAPSGGTPTGYKIYRDSQVIASNITRTYYRDESVTNGQTYNYQVTAVYPGEESDFSNGFYGNAMANGYTLNAGWASSAPNLDGSIGSGEWAVAATTTITYPGNAGTVRVYVMNDADYLYVAVDDGIDNSLDNNDTFGLVFDDNHNRELPSSSPSSEGLIRMVWSTSAINAYMGTSGFFPDNLNYDAWVTPGGIDQGIALSSGHVHYEGRIELGSSPLQSSPGNAIGMAFYTWNGASGTFTGIWPETLLDLQSYASGYGWFYGPFSYGDIQLASLSGSAIVRFQVDMTNELPNVNSGDIIGVRGSQNPLDWSQTVQMSDPEGDDVYWADLDFTGIAPSTPIEYKFVHHSPPLDQTTNVTWENDPNRGATLTGSDQTLPLVSWNNETTGIAEEKNVPIQFELHQNYPNPFNPMTTIQYKTTYKSHIELNIYDLLGGHVTCLVSEEQEPGTHVVTWNATGLSSGVYLYQINAGEFIKKRKCLILK